MSTRDERIITILRDELAPRHIELTNNSHLHAGHNREAAGSGDTHYRLEISAASLDGKSRVQQHQVIHHLLADEFKTGLHALEIKIATVSV